MNGCQYQRRTDPVNLGGDLETLLCCNMATIITMGTVIGPLLTEEYRNWE